MPTYLLLRESNYVRSPALLSAFKNREALTLACFFFLLLHIAMMSAYMLKQTVSGNLSAVSTSFPFNS